MSTTYEWDIETHDDNGDVIDHDQRKRLDEYNRDDVIAAMRQNRLALVRDVNNGGLESRSWAYAGPSGKLDESFLDSEGLCVANVPARFVKELAKATANCSGHVWRNGVGVNEKLCTKCYTRKRWCTVRREWYVISEGVEHRK